MSFGVAVAGDGLTSWSNKGTCIDVAAPGEGIYTTSRGGSYASWSGTSFSAPVTAGVAALVMSARAGLTGAQVQDIIRKSAWDLAAAGWDNSYGWGRVDAAAAVSMALDGSYSVDTTGPSVSFTSPAGGATVSGTVTVQVAANDPSGVSSVSLAVNGSAAGVDRSAPYSFTWNTETCPNGPAALTATATDASGNSSTASVTVSNVPDTTPPAVSITSPSSGARLTANQTVTVSAVDNVGVVRVELYVDGRFKTSSTSAPFTMKWNTKKEASGAHSIQARAYDAAGNSASSTAVTVYR